MNDPRDGSRNVISVGGPGGIQIEGSNVHVGGARVPPAPQAPEPRAMAVAPVPPQALSAMVVRNSGVASALLSAGATVSFASAALVIGALHLPWLLLAGPGLFSGALFAGAAAIAIRGRARRAVGWVDPEVERRVLDVAVTCRGRVTVTAVAHALSMPMAEADAALTSMARAGHVGVENDPASGVVVYVFPDIDAGLVPFRRS